MTEVQPPAYETNGCYTALDDRRALTGLLCSEGVLDQSAAAGPDLEVVDSPLGGMNVNVRQGGAYIKNDFQSAGGYYHVFNDGGVDLALAAADPTDGRIDIVIARVYDSSYSGALDEWHLEVVTGVPSPSPVAPATPDSAIVLAQIAVPAGGTEVVAGWITDTRPTATICHDFVGDHGLLTSLIYTANGSFTKASYPTARLLRVRVVGGGGGGGGVGAVARTGGGGGGGGGYAERVLSVAGLAASETVTVGAGGAGGGATAAGSGFAGNTSSFGSHLSANGGAGGDNGGGAADAVRSGGAGGSGASGANGFVVAGGAGRDALSQPGFVMAGEGGQTLLSPGPSESRISTAGSFAGAGGRSFGGGGGGAFAVAATAQVGGDGANGIVIVEVYA